MPRRLNFTLDYQADVEAHLHKVAGDSSDYRILSQSLDARGANRGKRPRYHYVVEVVKQGERFSPHSESFVKYGPLPQKPIVVGAGPAGIFCALRLLEYGIPSRIVERGGPAQQRMLHIAKFWRYGQFDSENNVCYGEGGAGLFSDGKLITRIKSPHVAYVMQKFVDFGAPKETAYVSNPHLGSNKIRTLISAMTDYLRGNGCEIHYHCRMEELLINNGKIEGIKCASGEVYESQAVILATGHSASEVYEHLKQKNIPLKAKDFAVGVRVEHSRQTIDSMQHGRFADDEILGTARYRLSHNNRDTGRGTFSFCMCPGGYVLSSGTAADKIVVNGMSNYSRRSPWSNAALVVAVKAGIDFDPAEDVLAGMYFQHQIEHQAYLFSQQKASGKEIPAQRIPDFIEENESRSLPKTSCPSGIFSQKLSAVLPEFITQHLQRALEVFDSKMPGFVHQDALLLAPETRTSAPVTIDRDLERLESTEVEGLYPCGEGAGYAGGITSAGVDGIRVAEALVKKVT